MPSDDNLWINPATPSSEAAQVRTAYIHGQHHQVVMLAGMDAQQGAPNLIPAATLPTEQNGRKPLVVQQRSWIQAMDSSSSVVGTYSPGDALGGLGQRWGAPGIYLMTAALVAVTVTDATGTKPNIDIMVSAVPNGGSATVDDGDPLVLTASELQAGWSVVSIRSEDWVDVGSMAIATIAPRVPLTTMPNSTNGLAMGAVTREEVETTASGDFRVRAVFELS